MALLTAFLLAVLAAPGLASGSAWATGGDGDVTASVQPVADEGSSGMPEEPSPEPAADPEPDGEPSVSPDQPKNEEVPPPAPTQPDEPDPTGEAKQPDEPGLTGGAKQADEVITASDASASLALTLTQKTGTAPFQGNDDPGNDSGPDNAIVRTNDTIAYRLGIRYEGDDQTTPTVRFTVPQGQSLVSLPPFCLAPSSSVTPATLPAPAVPLTADSWQSLPSQEVVCVLANQTMGTALNYDFLTQVRPEVPHGTLMDPIQFSATSDQVTTPATASPERVTVSAAAKFDLSKRVDATDPARGPLFQVARACPAPYQAENCNDLAYPVSITVPVGGRGTTPLLSPITFKDNLDPASFYGAEVWGRMITAAGSVEAATAKYAPSFRNCGEITAGSGFRSSLPYSRSDQGAHSNLTNSVRKTGSLSCPATERGVSPTITITGTDTTAFTVPTTAGTGNALAANLGFVVTFELAVAVPQAAVMEFGGSEGGAFTLAIHNEYTEVTMTSLDGQQVSDADPGNNDRDALIRIELNGGLNKAFTGIPGAADDNTPASIFMQGNPAILPGPPGSGIMKDGNTVVMPGQSVYSVLLTNSNGPAGTGTEFSTTQVDCDVWDADRLALAAHPDWNGYSASLYPGNNRPVFPVLIRHAYTTVGAATIGAPDSGIRSYKVEYSSGPAGPGAAADCSGGTWSENPDDIVTPVVDGQGRTVWAGINRVRVTWVAQYPEGTPFGAINFYQAIGQVALSGDPATPIGNWASQVEAKGVLTTAETLADTSALRRVSNYNPATHTGNYGDRLWQGDARARVRKLVQNPTTGEFTDAAVPQFTAGNPVRYRLDPSLTGDVTVAGQKEQVTLEDCLPRSQVYVEATQGGTALAPQTAQMGAPDGAEIACPADRQYLKWDLGELAVGVPIEPIVVTAEILDVARNGTFTNNVVIASPADTSPIGVRSDDVQMQLVVPTGIKIAKTVDPGVIEVNPAAVQVPRTLTWSVVFANIDSPSNISNVDVIDVLPANGFNGNAFQGSLRFDAAVAGDGITVLYTKTAAAGLSSAPSDASNLADGTTVWCDAASGGAVVSGSGTASDCPQATGEVTGLRFQRAGAFTPEDSFQADITMTPVGNHSGDQYVNIAEGKAEGVTQGVGPARRTVSVIASEVGDLVWNDKNGNGVQDDGEPGVANVPVTLTGTDVDGNAVNLTTTTGADGIYSFAELASGTYRVTFDISGLTGYEFTQQGAGDDPAVDSDADPATGATAEFTLGKDSTDLTIDAGVVQLTGGLIIHKQLEGAGAAAFGAQDQFTFDVTCTLGGSTVFEDTVTLSANGQTLVTSEELTPIPVSAECVVTETGSGHADAVPDPVSVTIPADPQAGESSAATASFTNHYSAGTVAVAKKVEGDPTVLAAVADREFAIDVTCQAADGDSVREVHSGTVKVKGGESAALVDDTGAPVLLPLGTRCFGAESDNGGADSVTIDADSFENGVEVKAAPEGVQELTINVTNRFEQRTGGLVITKLLEGAGVGPFAGGDTLSFDVACSLNGEQVFTDSVELTVPEGATSVTSDELGPIAAASQCVVTEKTGGSADAIAEPVTVTIPWNAATLTSGTVTASLTNYYSAGTVSLTKTLHGSEAAVKAAAGREFGILVTCQIDEGGVRADLYSQYVTIKGGSTIPLLSATGQPVRLPLGARCFGQEIHNGGAVKVVIDHDSFENGAQVVSGTPQELQQLVITAANTFEMAEFTVSKKVDGPAKPGAVFDFKVVCTYLTRGANGVHRVEYPLAAGDARFSLRAGQSRTIAVLSGTSCAVTEINVPDGVRVTIVDTDASTPGGKRDGKLADLVGVDNAVAVTNTFPKPDRPDKPEKPEKPEWPDRPETPETPDRPDKPGKPEWPDRPGKPETPDLPGQPDQPGEGGQGGGSGGALPNTGADSMLMAAGGLALLVAGIITTGLVRRRRS